MKILKIEAGFGKFVDNSGSYKSVKEIGKEDILRFLELIFTQNDIEMDECTNDNEINNPAEKLIYQNLYAHLIKFIDEKDILKEKINEEISKALTEYADYD